MWKEHQPCLGFAFRWRMRGSKLYSVIFPGVDPSTCDFRFVKSDHLDGRKIGLRHSKPDKSEEENRGRIRSTRRYGLESKSRHHEFRLLLLNQIQTTHRAGG